MAPVAAVALAANLARRRPAEILLAVEAFVLLGVFRLGLMFVPVRRIVRAVCRGNAVDSERDSGGMDEAGREIALRIRWAVEAASRNSPARFVCFPQALAGYTMLRWRGVESTIVYGVARSPEGTLAAHTWLTVGERTVLGGDGSEEFRPIERWR